ncbi:SIS domain-containing protein [Pseudonocardia sp. NPDC049635]|uniref:D-sedoheptulose-7-phosphate isomerase n=1 Tax=Pseudonocardia sp. NPDC049635 TaxID=3155506 RepID=UPI003404473A
MSSGFLYPFLDARERDPGPLLADLAASAVAKSTESARLRRATAEDCAADVERAAAAVAERFAAGGRMFTFGNGGSSTDAATLAALFAHPPAGARPLPAWSLTADQAILTALGNDVGFDLVFARQLIARGADGDIAVAMSTSGSSRDLTAALAQARRSGMFTIGFAGYDGGSFATSTDLDVCFVVRSQSVHRIQEAQALLGHRLWSAVHRMREERR